MRRLRLILIQIVIGLLALEGVLQVASFAVSLTARSPGAVAGGGDGPVILCVGDSFTYGLGSSSAEHSYPAVLERGLARLDAAPQVVNLGWPGQNSRDVLAQLEPQLARFRPRLVFILVGLNDTWSRPEPLELEPAPAPAAGRPGWRWRWRTARLVLWLLGGSAEDAAPPPPPPVRPGPPAAGAADADGSSPSLLEQAARRLGQGDAQAAVALFRASIEADPETAPQAQHGLVQAWTVLGETARARQALSWLEREWAERPDPARAEAYAVALAAVGDGRRAEQVAREAVRQFPGVSPLWWLIGEARYRAGDLEAAEDAYDRAIEHAPGDDPVWRALVMRACARACSARDPRKAIRLIASSLPVDRDFVKCRMIVENERKHFPPELVRECLAALELDGPDLELVQRLFTEALQQDRAAQCEVLAGHLRRMIERCRAHGAQPVVLTYPFPILDVEAVQAEIARTTSAELVPIRERFRLELERRSRQELFIPDGHCSDAGYALMGQMAAQTARRLLQE